MPPEAAAALEAAQKGKAAQGEAKNQGMSMSTVKGGS
jgi:hypothetical protein